MTELQTVKVMVVDDQQLMRDGISSLLGIQEGIEVIGTAANGQEAIEQALALAPDVILMDVRMPVMNGITATEQIRRQLPTCQVLMLTTFDDEEDIVKALIAGANGYLLKDIPAQDLAQAVRLAHRGIYQLEPSIAGKLVGMLNKQASSAAPTATTKKESSAQAVAAQFDLTEREMEVLQLIATGATNREIAEDLVVSEGTVKNHVSNILSRLGLRDRTQAAIFARENNLL
ncbi:MAG: DNA-binding response regulator [Anaerolineae bacterium]|nr:response regulator transcription factor [Anaerolineales bacterium]MCQ3974051.1 DNA-binding response regulator [Anaerolineae bacterium]